MSIVAIFNGIYTPGEAVGHAVAERLGYRMVGPGLLEDTARQFGTTADKLARTMTGGRSMLDSLTHEREKSLVYIRHSLAQMIKSDDVVYHGPAALLIPRNIGHVLRVGLVGDYGYRVDQAVQKLAMAAKDAAARIKKSDQELSKWTRLLLSTGPWDATLYDLKIPLPSHSEEQAVDLICSAVEQDALRPTNRSVQAVLDFLLATRINLALLEDGHHYCNVTAHEGKVTIVINKKPGAPGAFVGAIHALRYDQLENTVAALARRVEGVEAVETRPGSGFKESSRVLLVDDERDYVLTLSERLQMRDIESEVVYDGAQALSFIDTDEPEVMVLDLRMPGIDGIEVLRRVKRDHPQIEVIVVTGHGSEQDERMARELGAFAYLKKPVDIGLLAETMKRAVRRARGEDHDGRSTTGPLRLQEVLQRETVVIMRQPPDDKPALLKQLVTLSTQRYSGVDADLLLELLLEREEQVTTGIGHSIAVPHATVAGIDEPCCFVVQLPGGIDYDALDGNPVHLVFMLLSPPERTSLHIRLLARIARILDQEELVSHLTRAKDEDELYELIIAEDRRHV